MVCGEVKAFILAELKKQFPDLTKMKIEIEKYQVIRSILETGMVEEMKCYIQYYILNTKLIVNKYLK